MCEPTLKLFKTAFKMAYSFCFGLWGICIFYISTKKNFYNINYLCIPNE